jgi:hypothetical protein
MQIGSTPLDVLVLLDDGVTGRVELTGMIDVATRTCRGAAADHPLSGRQCAAGPQPHPEPMRPGWAVTLASRQTPQTDSVMSVMLDRREIGRPRNRANSTAIIFGVAAGGTVM